MEWKSNFRHWAIHTSRNTLSPMAARRKTGTELFLNLWAAWQSVAPPALLRHNPRIILSTLQLGARPGGVSQTELKQALGVNQAFLSKLIHKLEKPVRWIKITTPKKDRRCCLATTTAAGKRALANLENAINSLSGAPRSRSSSRMSPREIHPSIGQEGFEFPKAE